jgi:hypothetical protein
MSLFTQFFIRYPLSSCLLVKNTNKGEGKAKGERYRYRKFHLVISLPEESPILTIPLFAFSSFFPAESPPRDSALYSHYYFFTHSFLCLNYFVNYSFHGSLYAESPRRETPLRRNFFTRYPFSSFLLVKNTNKGEEHQQRLSSLYAESPRRETPLQRNFILSSHCPRSLSFLLFHFLLSHLFSSRSLRLGTPRFTPITISLLIPSLPQLFR